MFELPPLPFADDALEPAMSRETLKTHHDKHHATYIKKTNELIEEKGWNETSLEEIVRRAAQDKSAKTLFNNAAQAWNHAFFWQSLTPQAQRPQGDLAAALDKKFGGVNGLREKFLGQGGAHFASGWLWLVVGADAELALIDLHDAQTPIVDAAVTPQLTTDLWEHAYYLDHKNERPAFFETVFDALLNWRFAESQFAAAGKGRSWRFADAAQGASDRKRSAG